MRDRWRHGLARTGGPEIHYVEHGAGPLVVLLHGFPDFWYLWRHQIPSLASAGFRVAAMDMRGYNRSDKPAGRRQYRRDLLADDVTRVIAELGETSAHIVGHDWGGIVAWHLALHRPQAVNKLVVMNAPHPGAFAEALRSADQLRRSWYVAAFQLPALPEAALMRKNLHALKGIWSRETRNAATFTADDMRRYEQAFRKPGAVTAALNYYRALPLDLLRPGARRRVTAPTLLLWGRRDPFLRPGLAEALNRHVPHAEVVMLDGAGHWAMLDDPALVSSHISRFLAER